MVGKDLVMNRLNLRQHIGRIAIEFDEIAVLVEHGGPRSQGLCLLDWESPVLDVWDFIVGSHPGCEESTVPDRPQSRKRIATEACSV